MKKHCCKIPGCGKAFSRPSHLQRHSLNHSNTQWVCDRCSAWFKRHDLLERHKARHVLRDRSAGGVGLGVLDTKSKHFRRPDGSESASLSPQQTTSQLPPQHSPAVPTTGPLDVDLLISSNDVPSFFSSNQTSQASDTAQEAQAQELNADYFNPQPSFPVASSSPVMYNPMEQSPGFYEIGNMYHDMTFDLVHFNVTGFAPPLPEFRSSAPQVQLECGANYNSNEGDQFLSMITPHSNGTPLNQQDINPHFSSPRPQNSPSSHPSGDHAHLNEGRPRDPTSDTAEKPPAISTPRTGSGPHLSSEDDSSARALLALSKPCRGPPQQEPAQPVGDPQTVHNGSTQRLSSSLSLSTETREELLDFIVEIRPVRPDGTLIDGKSLDFSLQNMQVYLDLFMEYFNTSYPLIHVATLDINVTDPIALLSMILSGATYKDKDSHQLSVCLYDAIIPYILSGLLGSPVPDLSILQAFLILECYGMYRAGPYQRENAILIHGLLLNSIRRISRYHVRARITLPDRLTHKERDWREFAYAEQYKRLILFFFIWDTQNATCYSFMPNMSIQSLQISIPCSRKLWEASNGAEWRELLPQYDQDYTLLSLVKGFANSDNEILSKPHRADWLSFNLALHGLMSMANDMLHFDNRSIYLGDLKDDDSSSPWRENISESLESWKARYDAFAMETIFEMQSEPLHCAFQRDSMAVFALYHTAHIVINCEIRHLQTAAGAKAIFGHIVTPSDYEESCKWVKKWVTSRPDDAGRAAWHAAQMFREGMLNLKNWEVHGVFHYPWCLYIGTLTCWAYHHFGGKGAKSSLRQELCDHSGTVKMKELQDCSRHKMNHLVATMASVTPANMDRVMGRCCVHGLTIEMAKYLRGVRWTAAYEAMKILEGLSGISGD